MNLAIALHAKGQVNEAINNYKQAISIRIAIRKLLEPKQDWTPQLRNDLAKSYINLGGVFLTRKQLTKADTNYNEAISILETIHMGILPEANIYHFKSCVNKLQLLILYLTRVHVFHINGLIYKINIIFSRFYLLCKSIYNSKLNTSPIYDAITLHDFARAKSRHMSELLESTLVGEEGLDYRRQLRYWFVEFHTHWLNYCIKSGETQVIPEILSIIQGRDIAAEILDKQYVEQDASSKIVKDFHDLHVKVRNITAHIHGILQYEHEEAINVSEVAMMESYMSACKGVPHSASAKTLPEEYHQLEQKHADLLSQLRTQRELVVKEPGYEVLNPIITSTKLQARLSVNEAMLLAIDRPPHDTPGVLIIRNSDKPRWLEVPQLEAIADDVRYVSDGRSHSRGYRSGPVAATAATVDTVGIDLTNFWDAIQQWLHQHLWQPLATELEGITHLTIITHGRLHLLPIEAGAPAHLTTTRMPGLVFFAQRRGLIGKHLTPPPVEKNLSIDVHSGDTNMKQIPYVHAEAAALQKLYPSKSVLKPGNFPNIQPCAKVVHIACHGGDDPQQPGAAILHLEQRKVNQTAILDAKSSLWYVYINACIAARTVEDLNGTPSGLISALFRLGAQQVVGALVAIPDKWAFLLAVLTYQAMQRGNLTLETALREGKRRLEIGEWFEDTAALINEHIKELVTTDRQKLISSFDEDDEDWNQIQLDKYFETQGWTTQAQQELKDKLAFLSDKKDWINAAGDALVNAAKDLWFASRIPPQPDLGTLLYGVVMFGDITS